MIAHGMLPVRRALPGSMLLLMAVASAGCGARSAPPVDQELRPAMTWELDALRTEVRALSAKMLLMRGELTAVSHGLAAMSSTVSQTVSRLDGLGREVLAATLAPGATDPTAAGPSPLPPMYAEALSSAIFELGTVRDDLSDLQRRLDIGPRLQALDSATCHFPSFSTIGITTHCSPRSTIIPNWSPICLKKLGFINPSILQRH